MAPELNRTMEEEELKRLGNQIREYQERRELTYKQLAGKFTGLRSDRTFGRICKGDFAEIPETEPLLTAYRSIVALIESLGDEETQDEELYDDLWAPVQLRRAFVESLKEKSNARCIFIIGPSGSGKSSARRVLVDRYGKQLLCVEASAAWNGSPMAFLGSILKALGEENFPYSQAERLVKVVDKLNETPRHLIVEEAHHLGRANLNVEVTLINQTPCGITNIAIDTLWKKLESAAFEECRQLTGNRLAEVIRLGRDVREGDVRKLLGRGVKWAQGDLLQPAPRNGSKRPPSEAEQALAITMEKASNSARLAFVRDVVKRVNIMAEGAAVTIELFTSAIAAEVASR